MTTIDQCPSTKGKQTMPEHAPELARVGGAPCWRSVEEFAGSDGFRAFVEREFPAGASELAAPQAETRRAFLKFMAAGLALAGAATIPGCRRPDHTLVAYSANEPEHVIPGKALYFATSLPVAGGGAEGVLVETQGGRPIKIEGNPLHPVNRGKTSVAAQAAILGLYDPDRLKNPVFNNPAKGRLDATWDDFAAWSAEHFAGHEADGGRRLAIMVDRASVGPTVRDMQRRVLARFPRAAWVWWDPVDARRGELEGTAMVLGTPSRVHRDFSKASCVLSLDADFLGEGPDHLPASRGFAATRRVMKSGEAMSRLYVAESVPSETGTLADHRFAMSPSGIAGLAAAVAAALGVAGGVEPPAGDGVLGHAGLIAEDLRASAEARPGSAMVVAGRSQPAAVHALAAAMNAALGAAGRSVRYTPEDEALAADPGEAARALAARAEAGEIGTLVCVNVNPVYDASAGTGLAAAIAKVPVTVTLSVGSSETATVSTWSLNAAHELERWGDTEAWDGTVAPIQPMIAPLYEFAKSDVELLAMIAGETETDGYALVRQVWSRRLGVSVDGDAFRKAWRRALQDGVLAGSAWAVGDAGRVDAAAAARAAAEAVRFAASRPEGLEVVFRTGRVGDGRMANCAWLQELPQIGTQVVWDNPALVSPRTAERLGLLPDGVRKAEGDLAGAYTKQQLPRARVGRLRIDGREAEVPVWILPGMPDGVVALTLGYGRRDAGRVGDGVGVDLYAVRRTASASWAGGASLEKAGRLATIASTQNHWSLESRTTVVRALDKVWFDKHAAEYEAKADGVEVVPDKIYGAALGYEGSRLNLAEQMGELSHTPQNIAAYENPQNASRIDAAGGSVFSRGPQWGMSIDLNTCTGCGVCTVACQSENNIPVVGKQEVAKGREMSWIRVDRYFTGEDLNDPEEMIAQPVACVHCENAPCETVCPVNATVHGPEGTNNMAYNRCIGTRYCANNCPYKVRRFNFFEYGQTKYNGEFIGQGVLKSFAGDEVLDQRTFNKNFVPPRLREKLDEISQMRSNPDVTVRSRGVMEKCTYCVQRINEARQEVKVRDLWKAGQNVSRGEGYEAPIPDGFFETACQQACPTGAIVFGDILDPSSRVTAARENQRTYALLGYLNTRPRTTYMIRVRNPNAALLKAMSPEAYERRLGHDPLDHGAHGGGSHGEGGHGGEGHGADGHGGGEHGGAEHGDARGRGPVFVDPRRRGEAGYLASLAVLG